MRDVAALAGVAPATVSRFLNGSITLPKETSTRIRAATAELNYRPNPVARSLGRGVTDTIGLALPDLSNPFFGQLAAHLDEAAGAAGRSLSLSSTRNDLDRELKTIERLERGYFDVLLLATNRVDDGRLAGAINRNAARIVLLDEDVPGVDVPKVFSDNHMGGRLAGEMLAAAGHERIAYIGGPEGVMSAAERGAGLAAGASGARINAIYRADYTTACGRSATQEVLDRHPDVTGIFFGSDTLLLGGLTVLRAAGWRPGAEISVVSFDDVGPLDFFDPPISAIGHRMQDLARHSIEAALAAAAGTARGAPYPRIMVPVTPVVRASVAPPRPARPLQGEIT